MGHGVQSHGEKNPEATRLLFPVDFPANLNGFNLNWPLITCPGALQQYPALGVDLPIFYLCCISQVVMTCHDFSEWVSDMRAQLGTKIHTTPTNCESPEHALQYLLQDGPQVFEFRRTYPVVISHSHRNHHEKYNPQTNRRVEGQGKTGDDIQGLRLVDAEVSSDFLQPLSTCFGGNVGHDCAGPGSPLGCSNRTRLEVRQDVRI